MERLTSRKFLISVAAFAVIILNGVFDLGLSIENLWQLVMAGVAYVIGEAAVDFKHESRSE